MSTKDSKFALLITTFIFVITAGAFGAAYQQEPTQREKRNINIGWQFYKGDATGAEAPAFSDNSWTSVCLPHTFEYTPLVAPTYYRGIGWYRKHLTFPKADSGRRMTLYFEGAMTVAEVWVNGIKLDTHYGGFNPFCYDITDHVTFGGDNLIAVRLDNRYQKKVPPEKPDSSQLDFCFYGGIYRDVYIITTNKDLYIPEAIHSWNSGWAEQGGHIITFPDVATGSSTIAITTWVDNKGGAARNCRAVSVLVDASNLTAASVETAVTAAAAGVTGCSQTMTVSNPHLWSPWDPYLYDVFTTIYDGTTALDYYKTTIGIRKLRFTKDSGCIINGNHVKLLGINRHQMWPFVGYAVPNVQQRRDAAALKDMGCNFVRTSHYLQDDAFMEACDRLGILTYVEIPGWHCCNGAPSTDSIWQSGLLDAVSSNVRTVRNRPGVAIWGVGINEAPQSVAIETRLNNRCHAEDSTRPTAMARNYETSNSVFDFYGHNSFTYIPAANPASDAKSGYMVTEHTGHTFPTVRGDEARMINLSTVHEIMTAFGRRQPWVAGTIGWCAFDYSTPWSGPVAYHGAMDMMHIPKFDYYFYKSQSAGDNYDGSKNPMVFIANFYTASSPLDRKIYSNCEQVKLYRNNVLIATQGPDAQDIDITGFANDVGTKTCVQNLAHPAFTFKNIAFLTGELKAEGIIGGQVRATHTVKTPLSAKAVVLTADPPTIEANGADFSRIIAMIVDSNGTMVPTATNVLSFTLSGSGTLIGETPFTAQAGAGMTLARAALTTGTLTVSASAAGLTSGSIAVNVVEPGSAVLPFGKTIGVPHSVTRTIYKITGDRFLLPKSLTGKPTQIAIFDVRGRLVRNATVKKGAVNLRRDFGLSKGIYILSILP